MMSEQEVFFNCPYCYQQISMLIERTEGGQSYIEDCEICCQPIQVDYEIEDNQVANIQAKTLND